MMSKKRVKLAVIRTDDSSPCPFGLSIPFGCKNAGHIIDNMAPLSILGDDSTDEEKEKIEKANRRLLNWKLVESAEKPIKCKYAASIIDSKNATQCNFNSTTPGAVPSPLGGFSPYSDVTSMNGVYTYPVSQYADFNVSRNLYYGIFSLQGSDENQYLQKVAQKSGVTDGAAALCVCPEDNTILLIKRSPSSSYPETWGLPGGHMENGEIPTITVAREFYEEMGFLPKISDIYNNDIIDKDTCIIFVWNISEETKHDWNNKIKLNNEHTEYKWFNLNEAPDNLHPVAKYAIEKTTNITE